jgi:hypothetical protein
MVAIPEQGTAGAHVDVHARKSLNREALLTVRTVGKRIREDRIVEVKYRIDGSIDISKI